MSEKVVVMLGDSLTEGWRWQDGLADVRVVNQGLSGDTTMGVWSRLNLCARQKPQLVFLQIGINDLGQGRTPQEIADGHLRIWRALAERLPEAQLLVCSLLPVNEEKFGWPSQTLKNSAVREANRLIQAAAEREGLTFVDLYAAVADERQSLPDYMTDDGVHLTAAAYQVWTAVIKPCLATP
ncbi:MAG: GDSL-type esterase/lipase family protein [Deltaproteobacteria bacterium]|jgi:lysophospholipase L1-like esterase|nr:GDSL-type esterase/lipase family protein [Deltaproteobacteria bacterium]